MYVYLISGLIVAEILWFRIYPFVSEIQPIMWWLSELYELNHLHVGGMWSYFLRLLIHSVKWSGSLSLPDALALGHLPNK